MKKYINKNSYSVNSMGKIFFHPGAIIEADEKDKGVKELLKLGVIEEVKEEPEKSIDEQGNAPPEK